MLHHIHLNTRTGYIVNAMPSHITNNSPNQHMGYTGPGGKSMFLMQSGPGVVLNQNPQWVDYEQQPPPQNIPSFYFYQAPPTAIPPGPGSRFDRHGYTSTQALSHMPHMRLPTNQDMGQTGQLPNLNNNIQAIARQQFTRREQYNVSIQSPRQTGQLLYMNNNFQPIARQQITRKGQYNVSIQPSQKNTPQMNQTQQPTQMYSNIQQIMNPNYGGFGQQPGMRTPYMQNQNALMNPMSGTQNPAPPYTRSAGSNQHAQNSQYHQVTHSSVRKMTWSCLSTKEDLFNKFLSQGIDQEVIEMVIEKREDNLLLAFRDLVELTKFRDDDQSLLLLSNGEESQPDATTDTGVSNTTDWKHLSKNGTPTNRILYLVSRGYKVMVLMRGCPGSGKSYKANNIVNQCYENPNVDEFIFSSDNYFINKTTGSYCFDRNKLSSAHHWVQKKVQKAVQCEITPVIIDNTNSKAWHMETYVRLAVNNGYWIEILDPETEWAWNGEELSKKNIHNVPYKDLILILQQYDRNISVQDLLHRFKLNYNNKNYPPKLSDNYKMYKLRKNRTDQKISRAGRHP